MPVKTKSNKELTSSVYYFVDAYILAQAAKLLGNTVDYDHYSKLAGNIRNAINTKFFDTTTGKYASGSQTEQSVPLYWDVVPEEYRSLAADYLAEVVRDNDFKLDIGVLGATTLMHALSENGHAEAALRIALQKEFPSWGYWIMNGATTLHENWDPLASRDNSYNHMMFGAVGGWLFSGLAGIEMDTEAPGFAKFKLQPKINTSIDDIDVQFDSVHGPIRSSWKKEQKKDEMTY